MALNAKSLWYVGPEHAELREAEIGEPGRGALRVRARFGALSRGTESLIFHRRIPDAEFERMRAPFQWGAFPEAVSYGYINVGEVEAGDPVRIGEQVFCLYPHHSHFLIPGDAAFSIPTHVPAKRCILAANLETALNAIWDASVLVGQKVQVVGAGVVGCVLARLARRIPGVLVELVDETPSRRSIADALDVHFSTPAEASSGFDVVFECSGSPDALAPCLERVRTEGTLVIVSWYGEREASLPLGSDFHSRRLRIVSSQVGRVSPNMPHTNHGERLRTALRLLDDPALDALITEEVEFMSLPERLPFLLSEHYTGICTRIVY
ncbi:MAG: zinc-binding alcohol dehydrogenase [Myxococcota bacterium]